MNDEKEIDFSWQKSAMAMQKSPHWKWVRNKAVHGNQMRPE
jgi:hypothetical protein